VHLRDYFVPRADPFAGGDLENAQRLGAVLWLLGTVIAVVLLVFAPPTEAFGSAGWAVAAALVAISGLVAYLAQAGILGSWQALLAPAYASVVGVSVMQWLAGGVGAPYQALLLLPVAFVAAIQPPRMIVSFLLFVGAAVAVPFLYDGWDADAAGFAASSFVIWCGLAFIVNVLMSRVRSQRVAHALVEAAAREEARADALTGLHNRRAFDEMLQVEVKRCRRHDLPLSMAMLDIENFKEINERWSYTHGDRTLQSVAMTLRTAVREPDLCFRWGGDEFSIIFVGTTAGDAGPLGDRLSQEIASACWRPDGEPIRIRFALAELRQDEIAAVCRRSDGEAIRMRFALADLRDAMPTDELVELAGIALTAAKANSGPP
jgi:diguanylate cyclase (GGDEF)-like protein